jgi:Tol biopolymer transport system component
MSTSRIRRAALPAAVIALALISGVTAAGAGVRGETAQQLEGSIAYSAGSQHSAVPFQVYLARADGTIAQLTHAAVRHASPAGPAWSPDGSRLLVGADDGIYVVRADGSSEIRVSPASAYGGIAARWAPDSGRIAFQNGSALYTVDADGGADPRLLTERVSDLGAWSWSPDGGQIVYAGSQAKKRSALFLVNTQGVPQPKNIAIRPRPSNPPDTRVYHAPGYRAPTWSPDGSRIAFQWDDGRAKCCVNDWIYAMRPDGTGVTRLQRGNIRAWSPDSRKIVFAQGIIGDFALWVVNADGTGLSRLQCRRHCGNPTWFPDGTRLAYANRDGQEIVVARSDGSGRRIVARTHSLRGSEFSLSPDGSTIAYTAGNERDWNRYLYVVGADGSGRRLVAHSSTIRFWAPTWRPTSHARSVNTQEERSRS